jgi:hypothetical protein
MAYTGPTYRGVDYAPTWPGWVNDPAKIWQLRDSDFANDAFASLWGKGYQLPPAGDTSQPFNNGTNYRNDLGTIANDGFNLVRLYDWGMARGTTAASPNVGLDHINFLNYANSLGIKTVVPVSNYFLSNDQYAWNGKTPTSDYSFDSAPDAIKQDFKQFIASITDPVTHKIHADVHSISVGNETEIGTGPIANPPPTTAAQSLARMNWWIYNLHQQINGSGANGPDGDPVVNSGGPIIPISATFANGDQTQPNGPVGSWFKALVFGAQAGQATPSIWATGPSSFDTAVTGLATVDPNYTSYYYNSFNIGQSTTTAPFGNGIANTLALYDSQATPWPGTSGNVPLILMEVFTPNRDKYSPQSDQAVAAVNEAKVLQQYLADHNAGTPNSTTNLMGFNYFSFSDEPILNKFVGLYQNGAVPAQVQTGVTSIFYDAGGFPNMSIPFTTLVPTPGPNGQTLAQAWKAALTGSVRGTDANDQLVGSASAETFQGLAGNDSIDGGQGFDTALYGQNSNAFALRATTGSPAITIKDKIGTEGTDSLTNVEQVFLNNQAVDLSTISKTAALAATQVGQILKVVDLYTAGLGRAPDALGLDYWASKVADGASISDVAKGLFGSAEAAAIYSPSNTNQAVVNLVYGTAFGRAADAAGLAYWTNELNTGHLARTDLVTALIEGARGLGGNGGSGGLGADAQYVGNRERTSP